MIFRAERAEDAAAIGALTKAAFAGKPYSDQTEHLIVDRLRRAGALSVSLVAEDEGTVVGHIAFSPVTLSGGETGWYGLGPISVRPDRQGEGIGGGLIRRGLECLEALHACGCVLLGNPALYGKFGFVAEPVLVLPDVPAEYFMTRTFSGPVPSGTVAFHPGFYHDV